MLGVGGREGLVELGGGFGADAERGAGEEADDAVARGVDLLEALFQRGFRGAGRMRGAAAQGEHGGQRGEGEER
jgi:hypothetical protein